MGEFSPESPSPERPRFASARDEVLYRMAITGWANASSGDPRCHTGWFARLSNTEAELFEVVEAFDEEITAAGLSDRYRLLGHFLLLEHPGGVVVVDFDTQPAVEHAYKVFGEAYQVWLEDQE